MPLFRQTQAEKFTPKTIKFSQLYKTNTKGGKLGENILASAKTALKNSGYTDKQISELITLDKPAPVSRMKDIAVQLNRNKVFGFDKDPDFAIKHHLNKERVKAQSIAGIRKEHILEAAEANLANAGVTSLNRKAIGPNSGKSGSLTAAGRRRNAATSYSIAEKSRSGKTGSLISRTGSTSITRPQAGSPPMAGRGITIKPKY